ncbi:MAG: winged helix-turn-helix transcriptional regulator [Muribaculaceae bacterium]|nr:winged helix-turn-helix transcriptional regulator [Muribaculaceae bacterium]
MSVTEKQKTEDKIIGLLQVNPKHSSKTLAEAIGITQKGIEKQLAKLKTQGKIERIGPAKGGFWKIMKK